MTVKYKTVITKAGAIKLAAATLPDGKKVNLTAMAVGDGGGTLPVPDPNQTKLVKEVWRHALNKISQDKKNKNYVVAELLIPPETGGFWVRELGLYDDTGTLIAVGNMAESYKPALAEGSGRAQTVRMVIMVSDIESVELKIDSSTVMATQDYVDDKIAEHEQSRRHPDATLTAKGFTQLSSATDSVSESVAATPKAVKAAYDLASGKYTAQDATTARKGIVQLSSATDSVSESVAATPKAVKAAYDLASGKYTAQDATTARKGIVQLSSATDSASETLAATPKAVKAINDDLQKVKQTLGTASSCDVTASRYDATSGRVLQVGDYGLGVGNGAALLTSIYDIKCSGVYCAQGRGTSTPAEGMPDDSGNTRYSVFATSVYTNQYWVTLVSNTEYYVGNVNTVNKTSVWYRFYNKAYKSTAGDVGALPITGGALTGLLTVSNATPYIALRATGGDTRRYIMGFNSDGSSSFYVGKANVNSESCMLWNYTPGSGIEITADGKINVNSKGRVSVFNTDGTFVPAAWTNFDSRYLALSGGTVTGATTFSSTLNIRAGLELYAPQPYIDFHFGNSSADYTARIIENTSGNLYVIGSFSASKTITPSDYSNFDARYQAKGSYTPAGQAYTKAESNARYLQGWRLSAAATATNDNNDNLFADAPNGSVVVSVQQKTNYTAVKYRYAQYNLNGTWYNAGVVA